MGFNLLLISVFGIGLVDFNVANQKIRATTILVDTVQFIAEVVCYCFQNCFASFQLFDALF